MLDHLITASDAGWTLFVLLLVYHAHRSGLLDHRDIYVLVRSNLTVKDNPNEHPDLFARHVEGFQDFGTAKATFDHYEHTDMNPLDVHRGEENAHAVYLVSAVKKVLKESTGRPGYLLMTTPYKLRLDLRYAYARGVKERARAESEVEDSTL